MLALKFVDDDDHGDDALRDVCILWSSTKKSPLTLLSDNQAVRVPELVVSGPPEVLPDGNQSKSMQRMLRAELTSVGLVVAKRVKGDASVALKLVGKES